MQGGAGTLLPCLSSFFHTQPPFPLPRQWGELLGHALKFPSAPPVPSFLAPFSSAFLLHPHGPSIRSCPRKGRGHSGHSRVQAVPSCASLYIPHSDAGLFYPASQNLQQMQRPLKSLSARSKLCPLRRKSDPRKVCAAEPVPYLRRRERIGRCLSGARASGSSAQHGTHRGVAAAAAAAAARAPRRPRGASASSASSKGGEGSGNPGAGAGAGTLST